MKVLTLVLRDLLFTKPRSDLSKYQANMSQTYTANYSQDLRQRMQAIRNELPLDVQQAREEVNNLTDWKYYVRSYPQFVLPAVALAAYSLVPKPSPSSTSHASDMTTETERQNAKTVQDAQQTSILAGLTSAAIALATRSAINMATKYGSDYLAQRFGPQSSGAFDNERANPLGSSQSSDPANRYGATR